MTQLNIAVFGCGDFLRWQTDSFLGSKLVKVTHLYDPDKARAEKFAAKFQAQVAATEDEVFANPEIHAVVLFVPPWLRRSLADRAAAAGKHLIFTKPLAASISDVEAIAASVAKAGVRAGVWYGRTGNALIETYKQLFTEGRYGQLALYKQDWIHHYPQWNRWATDREKNGGPFMDAMIHNLSVASYLMGRPLTAATFFSDNHAHPSLPCADTESLKVDYTNGGSAHLFITWAADLAVYSTEGNDREHIDLCYLVTNQGWRLTHEWTDQGQVIRVARGKDERETIPVVGAAETPYDRFATAIRSGSELPGDIVSVAAAAADIRLLRTLEKFVGQRLTAAQI